MNTNNETPVQADNFNALNTFCYLSESLQYDTIRIMRHLFPELKLAPDRPRRFHANSPEENPSYRPCKLAEFTQRFEAFSNYLGTSNLETLIFISIYTTQLDGKDNTDLRDVVHFLRCNQLMILKLNRPLQEILDKGLISSKYDWHHVYYVIPAAVINALQQNEPISSIENLVMDKYQFCQNVREFIGCRACNDISTFDLFEAVEGMEKSFRKLPIVSQLKEKVPCEESRTLFYALCDDYVHKKDHFQRLEAALSDIYDRQSRKYNAARAFASGKDPLIQSGLVKLNPSNFITNATIELSDEGLRLFFGEDYAVFVKEKEKKEDMIYCDDIPYKQLFYGDKLAKKMDLLTNSLQSEQLEKLQKRLDEKALPTGIAALFYGGPGTGKTESVMQLAKATGRNVFHVDFAACRSMYYGETEQLVKGVFNYYRRLCKEEPLRPILLFNEADALFSKRRDVDSDNLAQVENTIQNIILEEMETFEGILIATTNLIENLDSAFARRFLFKILFEKPTADAKKAIWISKLDWLSDEDAALLAGKYDLSGGEIDNVARKCNFEEVLNGQRPTLETLQEWCSQEKLSDGQDKVVGF